MRLRILVLAALVLVTSAVGAGWKWKGGKVTASPASAALARGHHYTPSGWSWGEDAL